jgi:thiopeptide-type bacteriocin biosynthesis protein
MVAAFALARVALLSVEEATRLVALEDPHDPLVEAAIRLAWGSPSSHPGNQAERTRATTVRYISRMGGRATPFGLFAGTAPLTVGDSRRLTLQGRDQHQVRVRTDFEVLHSLVTEAIQEASAERRPVRRNRKLYTVGESMRYAAADGPVADVVSGRLTPAIRAVLDVLGDGSLLVGELVGALTSRFAGTASEALTDFVNQLIDTGVLQYDVALLQPGCEPAELAYSALTRIGDRVRGSALSVLATEANGLQPLDADLVDHLDKVWDAAAEHAPALTDMPRNRRFHLDLELATSDAQLDARTVEELVGAVRRLELLLPPPTYLVEFRQAFEQRFEDAEVPLLQALDLENGILRPGERTLSPLARSAGIDGSPAPHEAALPAGVRKVLDLWLRTGQSVDLADFPQAEHTSARGLLAALLDDHEGRFRSLLWAGYQRSPMALIGRFALGRPELEDALQHWRKGAAEQEDGPIHAELVYAPEGRISNVLLRPRLHDQEIALTGAGDGTITLDRLLIRLENGVMRLRDRVSGRDVVVETNSAHNVTAPAVDPVYSFLGLLVSPGAIGWSWGPLQHLSHLPRLTCGSVIVSPETWTVSGEDVRKALAARDSGGRLRELLPRFGDRRWIGVGTDDRVLPVDVTSHQSILAGLRREVRSARVGLVELPQVESPVASSAAGSHVTEVVVPLQRKRPGLPSRQQQPVRTETLFAPGLGASWVYAKYYCGSSSGDATVAQAARLARELTVTGAVRKWFYLRYHDEGHHIRVRMLPATAADRPAVVAALDELGTQLKASGLIVRTVLDDYVPEVARYGGQRGLEHAESLFTADSDAVARFVGSGVDEATRLYACVGDMLHWASILFDTFEERQTFLRRHQSGLGLTFQQTGNRHGLFFREHRAKLDAHLADHTMDPATGSALESLASLLDSHNRMSVAASVLHMHCNRLFGADARRLEFLASELAGRKLREWQARGITVPGRGGQG